MEKKLKKNVAVQVIKDHNISKIEVRYHGGGDDGCIDEIRFEDVNENSINVIMTHEVEHAWDDLLYNMVSHNVEWDWINNDGGHGQMTIDCTKNPWKVSINHVQRTSEDHYYDCDFTTEEQKYF